MKTQPTPTPNKKVWLSWTGTGMEYTGGTETGPTINMGAKNLTGPGPMDMLLLSVAGCMAVDVQSILEKSRVPVTGLKVSVVGERVATHPKRFTRLHLTYYLEGPKEEDQAKIERAVSLSRETFCSVLHTLRQDIDLEIDIQRT